MARTRTGASLIDDAYKKADLEAFTTRFPRTEVLRYINQGGAELWDLILMAMGRTFGRASSPWTITTTADTIAYTTGYPSTFLELLSVRLDGPGGEMLRPLESAEEAWNREDDATGSTPMFYELVPGGIRLFPQHDADLSVVVEYVTAFTDLADSSGSTFDGFNGWEDYLVIYAAREMMIKEGEVEMARLLGEDKSAIARRVASRAQSRDAYRPKRVRDVRGEQMLSRYDRYRVGRR